MTQHHWLDYFESINGRKPSQLELQVAAIKGEFQTSKQNVLSGRIALVVLIICLLDWY